MDLTEEERDEIPPADYLHVYNLWFNERAYEEIYELFEPSSTQGITLGEWLDYFEPLWGEWYVGLESLEKVSGNERRIAYVMERTFHAAEGMTPHTATQEMVKRGEGWSLILREDQAGEILAYQTTAPAPTGEIVSCDDFVTMSGEPSQWQAQQFYDSMASPEERAILDPDCADAMRESLEQSDAELVE